MHIVVCVKQIPDPEVPPAKFKIDSNTKKVVPPPGLPPVISVFDERAVELACRIKEKNPGTKITTVTIGPGKVSDVVKHALAMGADEGIVLQDKAFEDSDSFGNAHILAKAIQKIGSYDLILCGRQAADWDIGQTGSILAETLGIPVVTIAKDVEVAGDKIKISRVLQDGYEVVEAPLPCVVTVSNEVGLPRLPSGMGIIQAARKQVPAWTAADIGADSAKIGPAAVHSEIASLFIPARDTTCEVITADSLAEAAIKLAMKLRETKVV